MLSGQGYKRKRSGMASFLDVIFLLLFYVIMTTTFSRYGEVTLTSGGGGQAVQPSAEISQKPLFLQVSSGEMRFNGAVQDLSGLRALLAQIAQPTRLLIQLKPEVSAQELTDLLAMLAGLPQIQATVLE